jgi:hypothetical protein
MKKILKEWKSFLKESKEPSPNVMGSRLKKFFRDLKKTGIKDAEYKQMMAARHIIGALQGFEGQEAKFIKRERKFALPILDELVELLHPNYPKFKVHDKAGKEFEDSAYIDDETKYPRESKHFKVYMTGAQKDKVGSVSVVLEFAPKTSLGAPDWKASFDDSATLFEYAMTLREMVINKDYGFDIFTPVAEPIGSKPRGAGLGSVQTLPSQMPEEDKEAFDKEGAVAKEFARTWKVILDSRIPGVGPRDVRKHYENLLAFAEAAEKYYSEITGLWHRYASHSTDQHDQDMIELYIDTLFDSVLYRRKIERILANPVTREEEIDVLVKKAEQGDKEAAKKARSMTLAYKRDIIKHDIAIDEDQVENLTQQARRLRMIATGEIDPTRG